MLEGSCLIYGKSGHSEKHQFLQGNFYKYNTNMGTSNQGQLKWGHLKGTEWKYMNCPD